ncbi:hypothetical protein HKD37_05G013589 [Glycine soja]|uniref:myosin tail region-interacting protein MTI1-like n=1 Tax=Glycine max TaxID=3847 RepID=UPI00023C4DC8|nr:myosin tail region-interacting protein MTI1-like [Glycine max]|eukprot:XP_014631537.1 myosin tail region-interacting protein MTI1-like [Glycine max]
MADAKLSPAGVDCLEVALAKLTLSQLNLATAVDTLATTIDDLLQRLSLRNPTPHFSSSVPAQELIPVTIISTPFMSTLRLMPSLPPMPTPLPMPPPPPMPTPSPMSTLPSMPPLSSMPPPIPRPTTPPCPAPVQPFLPPLSGPLPMPVLHLPNLDLIRTAISFNKLIGIVPLYDHVVVPNDKPWKNKDMALFEMGHVSYGTAMAAQPFAFALCTTAK